MDALTHLFLPLTVAYVLRPSIFKKRRHLVLGTAGLVPDIDKILGIPGLFHSFTILIPICALLFLVEKKWQKRTTYATLIIFFIFSHLFFDFLDGSGVYLLFPLVKTGIGLEYPVEIIFGDGILGVRMEGVPVRLFFTNPPTGFTASEFVETNTYGFISGYGVASMLTFGTIYLSRNFSGE